jgi:hypothetical protein
MRELFLVLGSVVLLFVALPAPASAQGVTCYDCNWCGEYPAGEACCEENAEGYFEDCTTINRFQCDPGGLGGPNCTGPVTFRFIAGDGSLDSGIASDVAIMGFGQEVSPGRSIVRRVCDNNVVARHFSPEQANAIRKRTERMVL